MSSEILHYENGILHLEKASLEEIALKYGSPTYVYSRKEVLDKCDQFSYALSKRNKDHLLCYAVKANSNIGLLSIFANRGIGFDIVSLGELRRVLAAGGDPKKVVFSGVGKSSHEMREALSLGIMCFNVESYEELVSLNQVAKEMNKKAPVSIRVNPDVDPQTHPYISTGLKENKFGIDIEVALDVYKKAKQMENIHIVGVDCHIGSQLLQTKPFEDAIKRVLKLIQDLKQEHIELEHVDIGGGLGVKYKDEKAPTPEEYIERVESVIGKDFGYKLILEPGRVIVANAGVLLTKVEYIKRTPHKNFAIVDAAMNDLIRPSLYSSYHEIVPVRKASFSKDQKEQEEEEEEYDIVGPVCESGDFLAKGRKIRKLKHGDLLAIKSAGAYGFVMSSNYNTRTRAAEVIVSQSHVHLARRRETIEELFQLETVFDHKSVL